MESVLPSECGYLVLWSVECQGVIGGYGERTAFGMWLFVSWSVE
jgi:hypothetical protein